MGCATPRAMRKLHEHYASLGLVRALTQRAALLGACALSDSSAPAGGSSARAVSAAWLAWNAATASPRAVGIERLPAILPPLIDTLVGMLPVRTVGVMPGEERGDATCLVLDQLVSNTGFVTAVLHGLAAEVQAAAAAGGEVALACTAAVCRLFGRVVFVLQQDVKEGGDAHREWATAILGSWRRFWASSSATVPATFQRCVGSGTTLDVIANEVLSMCQ